MSPRRAAPAAKPKRAAARPVTTAATSAARPLHFATPAAWRAWLKTHHANETELWVGFHKRGTGTPGITWPESVDEALCYGWIDGLRKSLDEARYVIRFTPRKATSTWSAVNIRRVAELEAEGRMRPAGRTAFERRRENRSGIYAYERRPLDLPPEFEKPLRANRAAWGYWQGATPSYRKSVTWWLVSAKQEATRLRRLAQLVADSAAGRPVPPYVPRIAPHARAAAARKKRP